MIRPGDIYEWSKVDRTAISLSELLQHVKKERCDEFWIEPEQFGPLAAQLIEMDRLHHPKKSYVAPQEITVLGARIMVRGWH